MLGFTWPLSGRIIRLDSFLLSGLSGIRPDSKIHYPHRAAWRTRWGKCKSYFRSTSVQGFTGWGWIEWTAHKLPSIRVWPVSLMHFLLDYALKIANGPHFGTIWTLLSCLLKCDMPETPRRRVNASQLADCCQVTFENLAPAWVFCFQKWNHLVFDDVF